MNWTVFNIGMGLLNLYVGFAKDSTPNVLIGIVAFGYGLLTWPKRGAA